MSVRIDKDMKLPIIIFILAFAAAPKKQLHSQKVSDVHKTKATAQSDLTERIDTIGVFIRSNQSAKPQGIWFGRATLYIGTNSYLLYNGTFAIAVWERNVDGDLTTAYRLSFEESPDTIRILSSHVPIVKYSEFGQWPAGIDSCFLLMDFGTAPGVRYFEVVDLTSGKIAAEGEYSEFVGYDSLRDLRCYVPLRPATKEDCDKYEEYVKLSFEPYLEELYSFNLLSRKRTPLGKIRCVAYD